MADAMHLTELIEFTEFRHKLGKPEKDCAWTPIVTLMRPVQARQDQEWGHVAWEIASNDRIALKDVFAAEHEVLREWGGSFFRMRLDRMTPTKKKYIRAIAQLGPGPHKSSDIAQQYGALVTAIAPLPLFDEFMRRETPGLSAAE